MKKFSYTQNRLRSTRIFGFVFLVIGALLLLLGLAVGTWSDLPIRSVGVGQMGAGVFALLLAYYEKKYQYLTLTDGFLEKHTFFPKKIKLKEVTSVKEFAGDLTLFTAKGAFVIDTHSIDAADLTALRDVLNELKTPAAAE
jgi:hypothetical protein